MTLFGLGPPRKMTIRALDNRTHSRLPTVLLAEDVPFVATAFERLLSRDFNVVAVVRDGKSLIDCADRLRPDLIIADVGLWGVDGISATIEIRRRSPAIPVVLTSADPSRRLEAIAAGAAAFFCKSDAREASVSVVQQLLNRVLRGNVR
jgi:DNA-binding NarL/FixJ family response regulator